MRIPYSSVSVVLFSLFSLTLQQSQTKDYALAWRNDTVLPSINVISWQQIYSFFWVLVSDHNLMGFVWHLVLIQVYLNCYSKRVVEDLKLFPASILLFTYSLDALGKMFYIDFRSFKHFTSFSSLPRFSPPWWCRFDQFACLTSEVVSGSAWNHSDTSCLFPRPFGPIHYGHSFFTA